MNKKIILSLSCAVFIGGCAGSASHKVVTSHESGDNQLTCSQLEAEIIKTQVIIDDVNKDKEDISGADVIDGLLWFPFNLIAKSGNYKDSLEAAGKRIERLENLKKENNCKVTSESERKISSGKLSIELERLSELHKNGSISDEEYKQAKQKVLNGI